MLVYNPFGGLTTYLYKGYNLVAKYHGHPSIFGGVKVDLYISRIRIQLVWVFGFRTILGT